MYEKGEIINLNSISISLTFFYFCTIQHKNGLSRIRNRGNFFLKYIYLSMFCILFELNNQQLHNKFLQLKYENKSLTMMLSVHI